MSNELILVEVKIHGFAVIVLHIVALAAPSTAMKALFWDACNAGKIHSRELRQGSFLGP